VKELTMSKPREKWILLGASRGLGNSFFECASARSESELIVFSRKTNPPMDFSKTEMWPQYCDQILSEQAQRIFYFAGGGPFGEFSTKDWKDHLWAINVSFSFPAFLLHQILRSSSLPHQVCFVGSDIAENKPDPGAASYCAAKHALKGLVETLTIENPQLDLRLFSPGYMDTELLPRNAKPRQTSQPMSPNLVAADLLAWTRQAVLPSERHRVFNPLK
jgi:short-subunit dehydrogenase